MMNPYEMELIKNYAKTIEHSEKRTKIFNLATKLYNKNTDMIAYGLLSIGGTEEEVYEYLFLEYLMYIIENPVISGKIDPEETLEYPILLGGWGHFTNIMTLIETTPTLYETMKMRLEGALNFLEALENNSSRYLDYLSGEE